MTETNVIPFAQPVPQRRSDVHVHRDGYKRPIVDNGATRADGKPRQATCKLCDTSVPGVPYRRATTFIDVLDDRYRLELWKMRGVARGLAMRDALLNAVAAAIDDDRKIDKFCEDALEAAGTRDAATQGTTLHAFTEALDRGEQPLVPPAVRPDLDAYQAATGHLVMREIETFVVNDELRVAGTFDRIVEYDGVRYVADVKTGSIDWSLAKIAMQLAMYASSLRYDPATRERTPLDVDRDHGLIIHLPVGKRTCELVWVDLTVGAVGNVLAQQVWDWRGRDKDAIRCDEPPALGSLIRIAGSVESLNELWWANQHRWNDGLTALAAQRKTEIEAAQGGQR